MKLEMQVRSMLSKRMKDMLDRITTPIYSAAGERTKVGEVYDDTLIKVIDGRSPAEYKKLKKMDEINFVKGQYDA